MSQHQRLQWLLGEVGILDADQIELRAHWARYLCVLSAGFMENALKEIYSSYARSRSSPAIANYVESTLGKIQNPKSGRFVEIAAAFDKNFEDGLMVFLDTDGRREAIDAIMSNRHLVAHGKDSGITLVRLDEYLKKAVQVVEFIEEQCGLQAP